MKWDLFSKSFIFYKVEDSTYIRLYFINKKNPSDNIYHYEVVIQKEDSCLAFMAHYIARTLSRSHGNKDEIQIRNVNLYSFTKYNFVDGISFLSETFDRVIISDPKKDGSNVEMTLCYKTYDNGIHNSLLRTKGRVIYKNIFDSRSVKNNYFENFWIKNSGIEKLDYDFTHLVNMKAQR